MKKLVFLFALMFAVISVNAQRDFVFTHSDTLTNADTLSYVIDINDLKKADFYYSNFFQADSISGGTAGTAYFQVSNHSSGDYWYNLDTITINGVQTKDWGTGTLQALRARWYIITSGTAVTVVRFSTRGVPKKS